MWRGLPSPGRGADYAAEVAAPEGRIFVRENIGFHISEGCLGLVLDAVIEGLDDVFLEMRSTWMSVHHCLALSVGMFRIVYPQHVHFDAGRHQGYDRVHMLRNAGCRVQGDCGPDSFYVLLRDAKASSIITGGIGVVNLEALIRAAVLVGQTHVVEHRARI